MVDGNWDSTMKQWTGFTNDGWVLGLHNEATDWVHKWWIGFGTAQSKSLGSQIVDRYWDCTKQGSGFTNGGWVFGLHTKQGSGFTNGGWVLGLHKVKERVHKWWMGIGTPQ